MQMKILNREVSTGNCVFSYTNNRLLVEQSYYMNFAVMDSSELKFSRKLASLILDTNYYLHTQHICRIYNQIVDSLSQNFHILDLILSHLLTHYFSDQRLNSLRIYLLPSVIFSFIIKVFEACPAKNQNLVFPILSTIRASLTSFNLFTTLDLDTNCSQIYSFKALSTFYLLFYKFS